MNLHTYNYTADAPIIAAHRGFSSIYPENTLLAYWEALELGVDMLEIDLHLSKDGQVVLIHDFTLDRTTNMHGEVGKYTLEELKKADAGIKKGAQFSGVQIPTLKELCDLLKDYKDIALNVEIKDPNPLNVDKAVEILTDYKIINSCVFTCFDGDVVDYMYDKWKLHIQGFPSEYMRNFKDGINGTYSKLFAVGIAMKYFKGEEGKMRLLTTELANEFKDIGINPWAFAPDTTEMVCAARAAGATLITCNNPIPALNMRDDKTKS